MTDSYIKNTKFYVSVDCIIFGFDKEELKLLLLKRNFEPSLGQWSLMGGFVRDNESVDDAAKRVLKELTGLKDVYMEQVGTFGDVHRDPGARVISVAYYAMINVNDYNKNLVKKHNAYWLSMDTIPELIFDHSKMVQMALDQMRKKASTSPIGFHLLPPLFTLPQLQSLYEAIYGEAIDKRNFRKRIAEMNFIERTNIKDKRSTTRHPYLWKFNNNAYSKDPKFKI